MEKAGADHPPIAFIKRQADMTDHRSVNSLLVALKEALHAAPIEENVREVLQLQADLITFLVGRLTILQLQVELLCRHDKRDNDLAQLGEVDRRAIDPTKAK